MTTLNRRAFIKILHWLTAAMILYFFLVEPDVPNRAADAAKTAALSTHAGVGFLLGIVVLIWTAMFMRKGAMGKPGPKLPGWGRAAYPWLHKGLHYALPIMLASGLAAGLSAPFAVQGFGAIPMNIPGLGNGTLHGLAEEIHEIAFDALLIIIVAHAVFHLWRHFILKDNALRIIMPKIMHKYL